MTQQRYRYRKPMSPGQALTFCILLCEYHLETDEDNSPEKHWTGDLLSAISCLAALKDTLETDQAGALTIPDAL